jgi:hypothetical protein
MKILFFSIIFLFPNFVFAQYGNQYQQVVVGPPLYRDLINHGGEKTRQDIKVTYNGKSIDVPIINGWAPSVRILHYPNGSERHVFDYQAHTKWSGETDWSKKSKTFADSSKIVTNSKTPVADSNINAASSVAVEPVQKNWGNSPFTTSSTPKDQSTFMRRPSEINEILKD